MLRDYIVLKQRNEPRVYGLVDGLSFGRSAYVGPPEVGFDKLEPRDALELARAPDVDAVVPEIPLKLIRPVPQSKEDQAASSAGEAWGIRAVGALDTPFTGKGVKVAVLDTGIDRDHVAFSGMELTEVDYTGEGNGDPDGHGTHCAAIIFGRDVGGVRVGIAPGVTHAFIGKVMGRAGGGTSMLLKAIREAAEAGCQIVSMSLGFDYPGWAARLQEREGLPRDLAHAVALADYRANVRLFDRLGEFVQAQSFSNPREMLLFAASGNESRPDGDRHIEMPAEPPSEAVGFTSVGALARTTEGPLTIAPFSNVGCNVCAPGVAILSAKAGTRSELVAKSGTSQATPHVAGIAALYAQKERDLPESSGLFRSRPGLLFRILGGASTSALKPGLSSTQVGLGLIRAPMR